MKALMAPCPICGYELDRHDSVAIRAHFESEHTQREPVVEKPPRAARGDGENRYLKMISGKPVKSAKRPQVGKPNKMSQRRHRIIGVAGKSPKMRHAEKREAEGRTIKKPKSKMYSSLQEAMDANKPR